MTSNLRMKIAAAVTVLGLGGLAGFALASNDGQTASGATAVEGAPKPKVHTEVVHRTIHVRPRDESQGLGGSADGSNGSPSVAATAIETSDDVPSSDDDDAYDDASDHEDEHASDDGDASEDDDD